LKPVRSENFTGRNAEARAQAQADRYREQIRTAGGGHVVHVAPIVVEVAAPVDDRPEWRRLLDAETEESC
jgi:hypothetical protein